MNWAYTNLKCPMKSLQNQKFFNGQKKAAMTCVFRRYRNFLQFLSSFFPVYSFTGLVNGGLFLSLRNESKPLIKKVLKTWLKTCQVLTNTWLLTCQDLRLHLRRAKSKKWHDQSSTVPIQDMQFLWISTYWDLKFSSWKQKRMNYCRKFKYKIFQLCLFDLAAACKIWNWQFSV